MNTHINKYNVKIIFCQIDRIVLLFLSIRIVYMFNLYISISCVSIICNNIYIYIYLYILLHIMDGIHDIDI